MPKSMQSDNYLMKAYNIYSSKFKTVLILTLIFYIPFYLIYYVGTDLIDKYITTSYMIMEMEIPMSFVATNFLVVILNLIFTPIFMGSMYLLVKEYLAENTIDYRKIAITTLKLWPIAIITTILYYFLVVITIPFLIVPLMISIMFYFYSFVIFEGEKNPIKVLKTAFRSLKGNYFTAFAIIFLTSLLSSFLIQILFSVINISKMPNNIFLFMLYNLFSTVLNAYFYIFLSLWYKDKYDLMNI